MRLAIACRLMLISIAPVIARAEAPRVLDERLSIELFAEHPNIVTPTGVAVEQSGRVLVIESHTHFRPDGYDGPPADRIRAFEDTDGDGRADRIETFFSGTSATMNLAVYHDGSVYVATRNEIFRLRDTTGDGRADQRTRIAQLETDGDYPHNGLSGFAFDHAGRVVFGFGENLGADYTLHGTDGAALSGGGEGGNIYRCNADGGGLELLATGFWNPFHVCFDAFGRLFTVDNDPDSRPPCRLLHVVPDGDYGYRFRNGRKGLHPFTAWNGELPGTLPMVAGTGEAPSGVIAYDSDGLPDEYRGRLLVTSWGDHRIDRFDLEPRGASFRATSQPVVVGDEDFRPVGIALAPDGSLVVTDWVKKEYELHGHGRVWRIRARNARVSPRPTDPQKVFAAAHRPLRERAARQLAGESEGRKFLRHTVRQAADARIRATALAALSAVGDRVLDYRRIMSDERSAAVRAMAVRLAPNESIARESVLQHEKSAEVRAEALRRRSPEDDLSTLLAALSDVDPFIRQAARTAMSRLDRALMNRQEWLPDDARRRLQMLLLARSAGGSAALRLLPKYLEDPDPDVRFAAVQWAGESGRGKFRTALTKGLADGALTPQLFTAYLAALERLDGVDRTATDASSGQDYVAALLLNEETSLPVRRRALRILPPNHPELTVQRLVEFTGLPDAQMQLEAVFALCDSPYDNAPAAVETVARDSHRPVALRAAAIAGFTADTPARLRFLLGVAAGARPVLAREALRSLRGVELSEQQRGQLRSLSSSSRDGQTVALAGILLDGADDTRTPPATDVDAWLALLSGDADAAAGQRVFFHSRGPGCYKCHQVDGRGAALAPDLSSTARQLTWRRLIESILLPSREIAPQFVPWSILTVDGRPLVGVLLKESATGEQTYADAQGNAFTLPTAAIAVRAQHTISIMPDDLHRQMTPGEFRDLLAYLVAPR